MTTNKESFLVILRRCYLNIVNSGVSHAVGCCAAKLIEYFHHWTKWKKKEHRTDWIYQPVRKIQEDLMNEHSVNIVRRAIAHLIELGILEQRANPNGQDKTWQYKLNFSRVTEALKTSEIKSDRSEIKNDQLQEYQVKNINPQISFFLMKAIERIFSEFSEPEATPEPPAPPVEVPETPTVQPNPDRGRYSDPTRTAFQDRPWREANGDLRADFWSFVTSQMSSDKKMHPKLMAQRHITKLERSGSEEDRKLLMTYLECMNEPIEEWLDPDSRQPYPWFVNFVTEDCFNAKQGNTPERAAIEASKLIADRRTAAPLWEKFGRRYLREREEQQKAQVDGRTYRPPTFMQDQQAPLAIEPAAEIKAIKPAPMPDEIRAKIAAQLKVKRLPALQAVREPVSQLEQMREWIQDPVLQVEAIAWAKKEGYLVLYNDDGSVPVGIEELDF